MQLGLSRICITPEFPTCLACSQKKDALFERIHDDIFVNCLVLSNNSTGIIIMSYDLLFHSRNLHEFIYSYVKQNYNVPSDNILITFTHNHNSPSTLGYNDFSASMQYEELLKSRSISAIDSAFTKMGPGSVRYGQIPGHWAVNRRKRTDEGIKLAPNTDGPTDDMIYVLGLFGEDEKALGIIVNYACHPVHYPDTLAITGEYPGFLSRYIEEKIPGCIPIFIQGAGADARPASTAEKGVFVHRSFDFIQKMASEMADSIMSLICGNKMTVLTPGLKCTVFSIEVPTDDEGIEYFKNCITNETLSAHLRRNAVELVRDYNSIKTSFELKCGIIQISEDLLILHMGGEPCCDVRFNLSTLFKGKNIIFAGYTDGCAYIVPDYMIDEDGYEVSCFLEYKHKGRILHGIDKLIFNSFKTAMIELGL